MGEWNIPEAKAGSASRTRYRFGVPKLILRYPEGVPGAALLLMRLSFALVVLPALHRLLPTPDKGWLMAFPAGAMVFALALGCCTRLTAILLASALVASSVSMRGETLALFVACAGGVVALILLGPGAYSIDAHRYGRRVIRLAPRHPDRGSGA